MSRQLWDEARHAMMGEVGFVALGVDWTRAPDHAQLVAAAQHRMHADRAARVLYFIEQGLMTKTGKRYEWEVGVASGIPLMATIQDFDWADEVLHAAHRPRSGTSPQIGTLEGGARLRRPLLVEDPEQLGAVAPRQGLTAHENWWPALYRAFCAARGEGPDPSVEAFDVSYQARRADTQTGCGVGRGISPMRAAIRLWCGPGGGPHGRPDAACRSMLSPAR